MAVGDTKFEDLNIPELRAAAKMLGIQLGDVTKKADIIRVLKDNGATWDLYEAFVEAPVVDEVSEVEEVLDEVTDPSPASEPEPVDVVVVPVPVPEVEESGPVILRMTRANPTYQIRGYEFTSEHPYALVKESDADYLIEVIGGFRIASPREAKEFYGS